MAATLLLRLRTFRSCLVYFLSGLMSRWRWKVCCKCFGNSYLGCFCCWAKYCTGFRDSRQWRYGSFSCWCLSRQHGARVKYTAASLDSAKGLYAKEKVQEILLYERAGCFLLSVFHFKIQLNSLFKLLVTVDSKLNDNTSGSVRANFQSNYFYLAVFTKAWHGSAKIIMINVISQLMHWHWS